MLTRVSNSAVPIGLKQDFSSSQKVKFKSRSQSSMDEGLGGGMSLGRAGYGSDGSGFARVFCPGDMLTRIRLLLADVVGRCDILLQMYDEKNQPTNVACANVMKHFVLKLNGIKIDRRRKNL